ncbi:MAG: leucine-rich repeat domain-containing protein [Rubripirellula sp.]
MQTITLDGNSFCRAGGTETRLHVDARLDARLDARRETSKSVGCNQGQQFLARCIAACICLLVGGNAAIAVDRTTLFLPLAPEARVSESGEGLFADVAVGEQASPGWKAYRRLWQAHHVDPGNPGIRRFLGLPLKGDFESTAKRGRGAPRWLGWKSGSYAQVDTAHFVLYSKADREASMRVAEDLERCYWVWTQMFFPLWESSAQVSLALKEMGDDESVTSFLESSPQRITIRRKLRVVLCSNADEYRKVLGATPGVELSTGFYSDKYKTVLLFASDQDDPATRRHELVHQLFREATRSGLGRSMPAAKEDFWLIEGIAGYFESLHLGPEIATVGGWDSSRLQFARYRLLVGGDSMSMNELRQDGREAAQERSDIARWYAHAILRTHQLIDGRNARDRQWVYGQLATLYKVNAESASLEDELDWNGLDRSVRDFLTVDDQHLADNRVSYPIQQLCLAGCEVSEAGLQTIPVSPSLQWLDLSRLPVGNAAVQRLVPEPEKLEQLNLEATRIDSGLGNWLRKATQLDEVDLSWTKVGDGAIDSLGGAKKITTLWMTGTQISDQSVAPILKMSGLKSVDVQRTKVSGAGVKQLQAGGSQLDVNPLELRTQ